MNAFSASQKIKMSRSFPMCFANIILEIVNKYIAKIPIIKKNDVFPKGRYQIGGTFERSNRNINMIFTFLP